MLEDLDIWLKKEQLSLSSQWLPNKRGFEHWFLTSDCGLESYNSRPVAWFRYIMVPARRSAIISRSPSESEYHLHRQIRHLEYVLFQEIFDTVPPDIKSKLLYHLDILNFISRR